MRVHQIIQTAIETCKHQSHTNMSFKDTVNQLMQLGFDEEASRNALIMAGGDVQTAANALLS